MKSCAVTKCTRQTPVTLNVPVHVNTPGEQTQPTIAGVSMATRKRGPTSLRVNRVRWLKRLFRYFPPSVPHPPLPSLRPLLPSLSLRRRSDPNFQVAFWRNERCPPLALSLPLSRNGGAALVPPHVGGVWVPANLSEVDGFLTHRPVETWCGERERDEVPLSLDYR